MRSRTRRRFRVVATISVWLLLVAGLTIAPLPNDPSALADPIQSEVERADVVLTTNSLSLGSDYDQGYHNDGAAYYNDGDMPDCAVATGHYPNTSTSSHVPVGVGVGVFGNDRTSIRHVVHAEKPGGADQTQNYSYFLHTAQSPDSDDHICMQATVTTDASGYFSVTFPYELSDTPAFVVWSPSEPTSGSDFADGNFVTAKSYSGFSGRALDEANVIGNEEIVIDYWASTATTFDQIESSPGDYFDGYSHRGAQTNVTTDGNGDATINYTDFESGEEPNAGHATGCTYTGVNTNSGIVVKSISGTEMTLHIRKYDGTVLANQTTCVNYVAVGDKGGAPRPWQSASGDYYQIANEGFGADEDYTPCGTENPCLRWPEWLPNPYYRPSLNYLFDSSFTSIGSISGTTVANHFIEAVGDWNGADVHSPYWTQTMSTPGDEVTVLGTSTTDDACAFVTWTWDDTPTDGLNLLTHMDVWHNTHEDAVFGTTYGGGPPAVNCHVNHVYLHELGHVIGLAHNQLIDGSSNPLSVMTGAGYNANTIIELNELDRVAAGHIYGNSTSLSQVANLKASKLAKPGKGLSLAIVKIGDAKPKLAFDKRGMVTTTLPLEVQETWKGKVPAKAWTYGGSLDGVGTGGGPVSPRPLKPGTTWLMKVNDATGQIVRADAVRGGEVTTSGVAVDDVDGGDKSKIKLDTLRAEKG